MWAYLIIKTDYIHTSTWTATCFYFTISFHTMSSSFLFCTTANSKHFTVCVCGLLLSLRVQSCMKNVIVSMDSAVLYKHSSTHCSSYSTQRVSDYWESGRRPTLFHWKILHLALCPSKNSPLYRLSADKIKLHELGINHGRHAESFFSWFMIFALCAVSFLGEFSLLFGFGWEAH